MIENVVCFNGDKSFIDNLSDKSFSFFVVSSYTDTASIEGISCAGLPGLIHYTPALDMEILYYGYPKSLKDIPKTPSGPPSPVLITSCVKAISPFPTTFIAVGLKTLPKAPFVKIDANFSKSIVDGASVSARELFNEGRLFACELLRGVCPDVFMLAECVPAGTTTAFAVSKALGYKSASRAFASSFSGNTAYDLKQAIVDKAIKSFASKIKDVFDAVHYLGDNMQAFLSGMAIELAKKKKVILSGGTQMAAIYAILSRVEQDIDEKVNFSNIALMTTKWIAEDKNSDIKSFLEEVNPNLNAFYADFDFKSSEYENLRLFDKGYVKEGVGAGATLCYAYIKGVSKKELQKEIDIIYSKFK